VSESHQTLCIRVRKAGYADVLEVQAVFRRQGRALARELLQDRCRVIWNYRDVVEVVRRAGQVVVEGRDEPAEAMDLK